MDPDDTALVARLCAGDGRAFDEVYNGYRPRIFAFLARLSGRRELAEDLTQETFLRLVRFAPRLAEDTRLKVWLYTVARNLYVSHVRWAFVDMDRTLALGRWALSEELEPSPFDMAAASELERNLERALATLPLASREVLVLVAVERLPSDDAARILMLTPETLRQRLSRARKQLAEALEQPAARTIRKVVLDEG
jgi:RNA polymerase sigma-70 factor (ECF subfamily)